MALRHSRDPKRETVTTEATVIVEEFFYRTLTAFLNVLHRFVAFQRTLNLLSLNL